MLREFLRDRDKHRDLPLPTRNLYAIVLLYVIAENDNQRARLNDLGNRYRWALM